MNNFISVLFLAFFILIPLGFAIDYNSPYIAPGDNRLIDYNRYIDPNDSRFQTLEPQKYSDPTDDRLYQSFDQINKVKSFQGNIDLYSSNNSVKIYPDYLNSRINLICDSSGGGSGSDTNKVGVSINDTTPGFLTSKLSPGANITFTTLNPGANEILQINAVSGSGGKTYTSGTPATIQVNNDLNTISQNFDGNFSKDINLLDLNNSLAYSKTDTNCSNNPNCILTGKITTTQDINAQNIKFNGVLSGGDFNFSLADANGSQTATTGQALSSVGATVTSIPIPPIVGTCDNNILCTITGKINTGFDGNYNDMNVNGDINLLDTHAINFGDAPDWNLYDSSAGGNLSIRQKAGAGFLDANTVNVRIQNMGFNNATPSANFLLMAGNGTDTTARSILFGQLNYVGTLGPTGAQFGMDYNGIQTNMTMQGAQFTARARHVPAAGGTENFIGVSSITGLTPVNNLNFNNGNWTIAGYTSTITGTDTNVRVTGGNYVIYGYLQNLIGDFNNRSTNFGALFHNDVQINNGARLILNGSTDVNKGLTDFNYDLPNTELDLHVDGNNTVTFDTNGTDFHSNVVFDGNVQFYGILSGGDFNYSLGDANGTQSCSAGQVLQTVGSSIVCVSLPTSGKTYTSGTPSTLQVNNDLNTISQNFDGNFFKDINGLDLNNSLGYVRNIIFNNSFPIQDANIASSTKWNANVNATFFTGDILGTNNQVSVTNGTDRLFGSSDSTFSLPQDINTVSTPRFRNLIIDGNQGNSNSAQIRLTDNNTTNGVDINVLNKSFIVTVNDTNADLNILMAPNSTSIGSVFSISGTSSQYFMGKLQSRAVAASAVQWNSSTGNLYALSSNSESKTDIVNLDQVYDSSLIYNLQPRAYKDAETGTQTFGLIAEEVFASAPYLATLQDPFSKYDPIKNKPATVNYLQLGVIELAEMKKLKQINDSLQLQVAQQNQTITLLTNKITILSSIVCPPQKIDPLCDQLKNSTNPV